jgi:tryptophan synthase beta chain
MESFGASVSASPSEMTEAGRGVLERDPQSSGSLGLAISEAVEVAAKDPHTKYALGSVLNHVLLHQTVIGLEAMEQMSLAGDEPDVLVGCTGGGSNFAGLVMPYLKRKINRQSSARVVAVEPAACPSLTKGRFTYDFGDTGHQLSRPGCRQAGLRGRLNLRGWRDRCRGAARSPRACAMGQLAQGPAHRVVPDPV